jgi:hypothetical protein
MWCTIRVLTLASLLFGLAATGTLSLAVAVDFWLFTNEPFQVVFNGTIYNEVATFHSGLWRACPYYGNLGSK